MTLFISCDIICVITMIITSEPIFVLDKWFDEKL